MSKTRYRWKDLSLLTLLLLIYYLQLKAKWVQKGMYALCHRGSHTSLAVRDGLKENVISWFGAIQTKLGV